MAVLDPLSLKIVQIVPDANSRWKAVFVKAPKSEKERCHTVDAASVFGIRTIPSDDFRDYMLTAPIVCWAIVEHADGERFMSGLVRWESVSSFSIPETVDEFLGYAIDDEYRENRWVEFAKELCGR